jgi:tetratricopeptide (TPR) repeat protein
MHLFNLPQRARVAPLTLRTPGLAPLLFSVLLAGCMLTDGPGAQTLPAGGSGTSGPAAQVQPPARPPGDTPPREQRETEAALPAVDLSAQLVYQLLAAEIAAQRGENGTAAATYLSMARRVRDYRLARRATELALAERSLERALPAARLWAELSPASGLATQTLETLLLSAGNLPEAETALRQKLERARAQDRLGEAYEDIARALGRANDKAQALAMLERLAAKDLGIAQARVALAAAAAATDAFDKATGHALAALELQPDREAYAVAASRYLAQSGQGPAAATRLLEQFVARTPQALEARFALARLLLAQEQTAAARAQIDAALERHPENPLVLFSAAQLAAQASQNALAEAYLKRYVALPEHIERDNDPAWLFLGQLAEDDKRLEQALAAYAKVDDGEQRHSATLRTAVVLGKLKRLDEARSLLQQAQARTPRERSQLISVEAQILREAGLYQQAFEVLDRALADQPASPELLYDHGMAAERIDRIDVMEASLRKLIGLRPDHAHAYNALGYSLADRNLRLDEAQALIEKALELTPNDGHILDSMGWVLFRKGQYERAIEYLRRAFELMPDAEVAAHLGEVLWAAGKTDEARQLWRDARRKDPDNQTLQQTLTRLKVSL